MNEEAIRQSFRVQADACETLGSPFTARLCRLVADRLQAGSPVADLILQWPGNPAGTGDALALRLAGSLHALVLEGRDALLTSVYPPNDVDDEALWTALTSAIQYDEIFILERMQSAPQTNEVRRSAALLPGFLTLGKLFAMPLVLSEVGASTGLNLQWDRYRYRLGASEWGNPASPVLIAPEWSGPTPPAADLRIVSRAGCDLNPLDASNAEDRRRLRSYIWADQKDRLERTTHALEIAAATVLKVDRADAIDWLQSRLAVSHAGATHVVFHTIAWQYFPAELKERGEALIAAAGARATVDAPLARLSLEADGGADGAAITLQIWPSGEKQQVGRADFHGRWVKWAGWA